MKKLRSITALKQYPLLIFIVLFATLGVLALVISRAATPFASLEVENGTLTGVMAVSDETASAGKFAQFGNGPQAGVAPSVMPLISRGVPAFASTQQYPAKNANDADYTTIWRSSGTSAWLAYDLSGVAGTQREQVLLGWYNDPMTSPYDHTLVGESAYNNLRDYVIQANPAASAANAPTTGWVTLAAVTGNRYHSRQHLVNMAGYNWIRINITATDGSAGNTDAAINMDVHDASQGAQDSWIFIGDSITMDGMHHGPIGSTGNFSQLINAAMNTRFPSSEDAGIGGLTSTEGAANMNTWLSVYPGRYVGLSYGTNDANSCTATTAFYNNYSTMVQAVIAAGKIPVIPTIPASRTSNVQSCGPGFNSKIQQLYAAFPQIIHGPDLWGYFTANPSQISSDNLHPNAAGYAGMRQVWACSAQKRIYLMQTLPLSCAPYINYL
jgi:lysophospholipase L1-like esterase